MYRKYANSKQKNSTTKKLTKSGLLACLSNSFEVSLATSDTILALDWTADLLDLTAEPIMPPTKPYKIS